MSPFNYMPPPSKGQGPPLAPQRSTTTTTTSATTAKAKKSFVLIVRQHPEVTRACGFDLPCIAQLPAQPQDPSQLPSPTAAPIIGPTTTTTTTMVARRPIDPAIVLQLGVIDEATGETLFSLDRLGDVSHMVCFATLLDAVTEQDVSYVHVPEDLVASALAGAGAAGVAAGFLSPADKPAPPTTRSTTTTTTHAHKPEDTFPDPKPTDPYHDHSHPRRHTFPEPGPPAAPADPSASWTDEPWRSYSDPAFASGPRHHNHHHHHPRPSHRHSVPRDGQSGRWRWEMVHGHGTHTTTTTVRHPRDDASPYPTFYLHATRGRGGSTGGGDDRAWTSAAHAHAGAAAPRWDMAYPFRPTGTQEDWAPALNREQRYPHPHPHAAPRHPAVMIQPLPHGGDTPQPFDEFGYPPPRDPRAAPPQPFDDAPRHAIARPHSTSPPTAWPPDPSNLPAHLRLQPTLVGTLTSSCHLVTDLDGRKGAYFVFSDLFIRCEGRFRLRIHLSDLTELLAGVVGGRAGGRRKGEGEAEGKTLAAQGPLTPPDAAGSPRGGAGTSTASQRAAFHPDDRGGNGGGWHISIPRSGASTHPVASPTGAFSQPWGSSSAAVFHDPMQAEGQGGKDGLPTPPSTVAMGTEVILAGIGREPAAGRIGEVEEEEAGGEEDGERMARVLAECVTDAFEVVGVRDWSGVKETHGAMGLSPIPSHLKESSDLSKHLADQGVKLPIRRKTRKRLGLY
ncbi:hypothetical protein HDU96_002587, partial [Phlyctochytrium bullatum]